MRAREVNGMGGSAGQRMSAAGRPVEPSTRFMLTAKGCEASGGHAWSWFVTPNIMTCRRCGTELKRGAR